MGGARKQLENEARWARLRDDAEHDRPDPQPSSVKTPCRLCPTLCWGDYCRDHIPSGPDDRRVRSKR